MIPFDRIYSWLFKSFNISGESILINRLIEEWYQEFMIIKRSWIFALFIIWLPISILILSCLSIFIAYYSITIDSIRYTLIIGNILMALILLISSLNYTIHFKRIHHEPQITKNIDSLKGELDQWDTYFKSFFNWSITNQLILIIILIVETILVIFYGKYLGSHYMILSVDIIVIIVEIGLLRQYRKRMMDLEMDYNVFIPWKIFFINQSSLLSTIQTIEWEKIKTVQSIFPSKIASFFNYGTINVLTEGDSAMIGTMSMYYVTNPDKAVSLIQSLVDEVKNTPIETTVVSNLVQENELENKKPQEVKLWSQRHSLDTREKIRDVLR